MSDKEKKILETFGELIPKLSETEKEKLLSFGEGMVFIKNRQDYGPEKVRKTAV